MGLFDEYGIDPDEVPDVPSYDVEDGIYEFEVSNYFIWVADDESRSCAVIEYTLGDEGKKTSEWFNLPEDADAPTEAELKKLGFLKQRIMSLGFSREQVKEVEGEDLIGIVGTLQLKTTQGRNGKSYQNVRNVRVDAPDEEPEEETPKAKAPVRKGKAAPEAQVKANPFAKKSK